MVEKMIACVTFSSRSTEGRSHTASLKLKWYVGRKSKKTLPGSQYEQHDSGSQMFKID